MVRDIINALQAEDYYGVDDLIDFAKGSNYAPKNFKEARQLIKRKRYGSKRGDN